MFRVCFVADYADIFGAGVSVVSRFAFIANRTDSEGAVISPVSNFGSGDRVFAFAFGTHGDFEGLDRFRENSRLWFRVRGFS